jgi:hypothetical protein
MRIVHGCAIGSDGADSAGGWGRVCVIEGLCGLIEGLYGLVEGLCSVIEGLCRAVFAASALAAVR